LLNLLLKISNDCLNNNCKLVMYKNYYYLNRLVIELNKFVPGSTLNECFSQESDRLVLSTTLFALIISANQNEPFIIKRDEFHKAKKNVLNFFPDYLPSNIQKVFIADDDRIILFLLDKGNLYFLMRGKDTNVVFISESLEMFSFKKISEDHKHKLIEELSSKQFLSGFNLPEFENNTVFDISDKNFLKKFPSISKEIVKELETRLLLDKTRNPKETLLQTINEILKGKIKVQYDNFADRMILLPEKYHSNNETTPDLFESYLEAIAFFIANRYKQDQSDSLKRTIEKYLTTQLSKLSTKLNELKNQTELPSREVEFREVGNSLLLNIHKIKKGMKEVRIEVENVNVKKNVILDPKLSPKQNIDLYFEKARDEKEKKKHYTRLFEDTLSKYEKFQSIQINYDNSDSIKDLQKLMDELKIKPGAEKDSRSEQNNFKHYLIEGKYHIYVGKNSKNNDELTTKFAKQNDFWFHARSVSGSHTVLRVENTKEPIPKSILKKAAAIAAYHSKAKTSGLASVSYTLKKYVVKRKGMEIGSVSLLKEEVLLVKPEIPTGCEFIPE